jgi:hypothetical protein
VLHSGHYDDITLVGAGVTLHACLRAAGQSHLRLTHLAVRGLPGSGSGAQLLAWAGIEADHIAAAARTLIDPAQANLGWPRFGARSSMRDCPASRNVLPEPIRQS